MRAFNHVAWFASIVAVMGCEPPSEGNDGKEGNGSTDTTDPRLSMVSPLSKNSPQSPLAGPPIGKLLEDAGWEGSSEPICDDAVEGNTLDVWADARGVFVLASDKCNRAVLILMHRSVLNERVVEFRQWLDPVPRKRSEHRESSTGGAGGRRLVAHDHGLWSAACG